MQDLLRLILGLIVTTLIGWLLLKSILRKERRPLFEEMALSYGLGMGVIALEFILFWFIDIRPTLMNILLPWALIFFLYFFIKRVPLDIIPKKEKRGYAPFEIFLLFGIGLEVILSFFRAIIKPIESFDSVAIYAIRAKVFYEAGCIPKDFFSQITHSFPNSSHPLIVPLIENWVYILMGNLNDFLVKLIFPLYLLSLLTIFYFSLREFFDRKRGLLFTFILATIPQFNRFSSIGYADFVLAYYFTAGALYLFYWMKKKKTQYLILSALFIALSCWSKIEGWALSLCTVLVSSLFIVVNYRKKMSFFKLGIFVLAVLLIALPWGFLINSMRLESDVFDFRSLGFSRFILSFLNFDRLPRIIYEFQKQFFGPKKWNIIWVILLALFFLNLKYAFTGDIRYITILLLSIIVMYGYCYLMIPLKEGDSINWFLGSTLSRLFIHFTPLSCYWLACLCRDKGYI